MPRISVSGNAPDSESQWTQLYLGLGFTTLATLLLELSLTRVFSVVFFPDFTFLVISLALFGLSAGGLFSYAIANRPGNLSSELGRLTFINSVVVVLLLWFILTSHGEISVAALTIVPLVSAVPFFFAGTVMSLAVSEAIGRIDRAYLWNLMGAAAACLLLGPFLTFFGGPNTVIASGVIYGIAASIWFNRAGQAQLRASAALVSILLVTLMIMNGTNHMFDVRWAKGERMPEERLAKWNAVSRVGMTKSGEIRVDANAPLRPLDGARIAHLLRPGAKTLILGAVGGYDLADKDVTVVEPNSIVADLTRGGFPGSARILVEDPRSFIRRTQEKYQVIQATSTEVLEEYLARLTDDGILALSESDFDWRPLVANDTARRVIVLDDTVLISRTPFSEADLEHAAHTASELGLDVLFLPGIAPPARLNGPKDSTSPLLYGLMAVATALVMLLPRLALVPGQKGIYASLFYFLFSGAGYLLVQITLIQEVTVLLGQPARALTVIVFSMLLASGAGSYFSRTVISGVDRRLMMVLAGTATVIAILAAAPLVSVAATWPTAARILLVIVAIAPAAFLMGMPFPSGLRRLEERHAPALRWAWSLNAAASVMGSVASIVLATSLGLRATLLIGGALYLAAILALAADSILSRSQSR